MILAQITSFITLLFASGCFILMFVYNWVVVEKSLASGVRQINELLLGIFCLFAAVLAIRDKVGSFPLVKDKSTRARALFAFHATMGVLIISDTTFWLEVPQQQSGLAPVYATQSAASVAKALFPTLVSGASAQALGIACIVLWMCVRKKEE
ncbi:hypothetical protein H4S06_002310 [Coemansia sp. BCRC 34490]|nr:hypothetical protein LPJ72_006280 [Coemansia sp. Benny D160-2]KAJ2759274.1 hypothetical protein H4S06_002310 [Coemansia sp. BCRC 34490]